MAIAWRCTYLEKMILMRMIPLACLHYKRYRDRITNLNSLLAPGGQIFLGLLADDCRQWAGSTVDQIAYPFSSSRDSQEGGWSSHSNILRGMTEFSHHNNARWKSKNLLCVGLIQSQVTPKIKNAFRYMWKQQSSHSHIWYENALQYSKAQQNI